MRLPRLPAALLLLAAVVFAAGPASADPLSRFGNRSWWTTDESGPVAVAASGRLDLFAVRVPDVADVAAVADLVDQLVAKVPGAQGGVVAAWPLDATLVAVQLGAALQPAQAATLARFVEQSVQGHLWPALGRGPVGVDGIAAGRAFSDDRLVITAAPGQLDEVLAKITATVDGTDVVSARVPNTASLRVGAAFAFDAVSAAVAVHTLPGVVAAEPDLRRELKALATVDDPLFDRQWHLGGARLDEAGAAVPGAGQIFADVAWDTTKGDPAVVIAVFDSGTDWQHPDLLANVNQDLMFDASGNDGDPKPECEGSQDGVAESPLCPSNRPYRESHGTSVSGTIAAVGDNGIGVSGVCPQCSLAPVRLLGEESQSSISIANAFVRACDPDGDGTGKGVSAINNSWGPGFSLYFPLSSSERAAFEVCRTVGRGGKGTVILFATGNEQSDVSSDAYAKHPYVIGVAASTNLDDWAAYSNYGAEVDVAAPSLGGTIRNDNYGIVCTDVRGEEGYSITGQDQGVGIDYNPGFSGTSAATPVVSGVVGLILSANPALTAEQVHLVLTRSADKIRANQVPWQDIFGQDLEALFDYDDTGHSIAFGYGRVNAAAAVALALDPVVLGTVGTRCVVNADCGADSCIAGVCLEACTAQADCDDGTICTDNVCELPNEKPGSFLSPCDTDVCTWCVGTVDSRFEPVDVCTIECQTDEDCDPSCADGECSASRFDCRPVTSDPGGVKVCAVGDPNGGGPADFGACFNEQFFVSVQVVSTLGKELCGELCFDDGPAACAYGFHCTDAVDCTCTRDTNRGCREFTCVENPNASGGFLQSGLPMCVPNEGYADVCASNDDCQRGDYCSPSGRCRYDDRDGCDICASCNSSDDCSGRGFCAGATEDTPGVCTVACDDGETCPGNSSCREVSFATGPFGGVRPQMACLDDRVETIEGAGPQEYCLGFTCDVACRNDVPCANDGVCTDGVCGPPPTGEGEGEGEGEPDVEVVLAGGGVRWASCAAVDPGSFLLLAGFAGLLRRRRRR